MQNYEDNSIRDLEIIENQEVESDNFQENFLQKFDMGLEYWGERVNLKRSVNFSQF